MTNESEHSPVLGGCEVLPPMESPEQDHNAPPRRKTNQRNTGNRFGILNDFVDFAAGELTRSSILVWLVLYRDTRNGIAKTSQAAIARRVKISERTVRYAINDLIGRGFLTLVYRGGINDGPSKYRVLGGCSGGLPRQ